jgi:hypothetical protein
MRAMSRTRVDATTRTRFLLASVVGAVLASLLPSLLATSVNAPAAVTLAVVLLALTAITQLGNRFGVVATRVGAATHAAGREKTLLLAGRVTDPVHHPLRPRAPGMA